jgi:hypothetical protein
MSAEVRAALGVEAVRHVRAAPLAAARCLACRRPLPESGPVNVVVLRGSRETHAAYAHPEHAESAVRDVPDTQLAEAWPDEQDMSMTPLMLTQGGGLLAALVAELPVARAFVASGPAGSLGELTDAHLSALLDPAWGFALVSRLREAPRRIASCVATFAADDDRPVQLDVLGPRGTILYTGAAGVLPAGWREAADRLGWCALYAGRLSLGPAGAASDALRELRAAAGRGELVGARVPVRWTPGGAGGAEVL